MLFRAVPFVVERGRPKENVCGNARAFAGQRRRCHRRRTGPSRVHESCRQRNVPDESDFGGHRQGFARGVRVLGVSSAGRSKHIIVDAKLQSQVKMGGGERSGLGGAQRRTDRSR